MLLIGMVLLGVLLVYGAYRVAQTARCRIWLASQLEPVLQRELMIGPIHIERGGLRVDSLTLSNPPNFHQGTFVACKGLYMRPSWRDLAKSGAATLEELSYSPYKLTNSTATWNVAYGHKALTLISLDVGNKQVHLNIHGDILYNEKALALRASAQTRKGSPFGETAIDAEITGPIVKPQIWIKKLTKKRFKAKLSAGSLTLL